MNTFLIYAGGQTALMETGCGPFMQAIAGKQLTDLAPAAATPGDVDAILLTRMHLTIPPCLPTRKRANAFSRSSN